MFSRYVLIYRLDKGLRGLCPQRTAAGGKNIQMALVITKLRSAGAQTARHGAERVLRVHRQVQLSLFRVSLCLVCVLLLWLRDNDTAQEAWER